MKAFLLAAGLGTRLWPLSDERAKPAFPFLGTPLVRHVAQLALNAGARGIWANTHYLPNSVRAALADFSPRVEIVHEPEILGTGGALVNLAKTLGDDTVVVINAKIVTDIDLRPVLAAHEKSGACVTMVCVPNVQREKFTHVQSGDDGELHGFIPIDALHSVKEPWLFTGIQILSPAFFADLPAPGFCDTIKDIYPRLTAAKRRIVVYKSQATWSEFSTVRRYRDLHLKATGGKGFTDPSAKVQGEVQDSVVWKNARIGRGARLQGCVVGEGAVVPEGYTAKDAVLMAATNVREPRDSQRSGDLLDARIA